MMRKTARVVIELVFHSGRVPKAVLEEMVMAFSDMGDQLCAPYKRHDDTLSCRVFYDDFSGVPQVSVLDVIHKPDLMRLFRLGRKKVNPNVGKG